MKRTAMMAVIALLSVSQIGLAQQDTDTEATVKPGTEATPAMSEEVPAMKGECPDTAEVDTQAPGTSATEAMSEEVPAMTADAGECVEEDSASSNSN